MQGGKLKAMPSIFDVEQRSRSHRIGRERGQNLSVGELVAQPTTEADANVVASHPSEHGHRLALLVDAEVSLAAHSDSNLYVGFDANEPEGVFSATYEDLALGTPVALSLFLPGNRELFLSATVEWSRALHCADGPPGIGLRFDALTEHQTATLKAFARRREPLFHIM